MAYAGVLLIALVNCVVLFFASLLAVGGDGSSDGIKLVWYLGYPWIALFTVAGFVLCLRGKGMVGVALVASTLPLAWLAGLLVIIGGALLGFKVG